MHEIILVISFDLVERLEMKKNIRLQFVKLKTDKINQNADKKSKLYIKWSSAYLPYKTLLKIIILQQCLYEGV